MTTPMMAAPWPRPPRLLPLRPGPARPAPAPADPAVQVTRVYEAAFNRQPDGEGLALWTNLLQTGTGLDAIADALVASREFRPRFDIFENDGDEDDDDGDDFNDTGDFVDLMYLSALRRHPDDAGEDLWEDGLQAGRFDRGDVLLAFSQSPEFLAKTAPGNDDPLV